MSVAGNLISEQDLKQVVKNALMENSILLAFDAR